MKIKFNRTCKDKNTGEMYSAGMIKEFDDARALEIINTGYADEYVETVKEVVDIEKHLETLEEPKEDEKVQKEEEVVDEDVEVIKLSDLTVKELKEMCKEVGVATTGSKDELIERLLATQE